MFNPRMATASVTRNRPTAGAEVLDDVDDEEEERDHARRTPSELEHAVHRRLALDDEGQRAHTRSTRFDPNRPCGRKYSTMRITSSTITSDNSLPTKVNSAGAKVSTMPDEQAADDGTLDRVEPADARGREAEQQHRRHEVEIEDVAVLSDDRAGDRADAGGERPAEHQHPLHRDADDQRRLGVGGNRAIRETRAWCASATG